jgi:hypothetical protein
LLGILGPRGHAGKPSPFLARSSFGLGVLRPGSLEIVRRARPFFFYTLKNTTMITTEQPVRKPWIPSNAFTSVLSIFGGLAILSVVLLAPKGIWFPIRVGHS